MRRNFSRARRQPIVGEVHEAEARDVPIGRLLRVTDPHVQVIEAVIVAPSVWFRWFIELLQATCV